MLVRVDSARRFSLPSAPVARVIGAVASPTTCEPMTEASFSVRSRIWAAAAARGYWSAASSAVMVLSMFSAVYEQTLPSASISSCTWPSASK